MGQFSWIYSDNGKQMLDDVEADSYLLVPEPFQREYGRYIKETYYEGYGIMGGYDVYDLVSRWNKEFLTSEIISPKPKREECETERIFKALTDMYNEKISVYEDYKNLSDADMKEKYGNDYERHIGINIACYDEQNASLPYPIKITSVPCEYRYASPSVSDPNQGWKMEDDDWEDD